MNTVITELAAQKRSPLALTVEKSLPFLVGGGVILATLGLWHAANVQERSLIHSKVRLGAEAVKNEVQSRLKLRIVGLQQLINPWDKLRQLGEAEWQIAAKNYLNVYPNCQTLQWVDASLQPRWTVSRSGVEALAPDVHRQVLMPRAHKWKDLIAVPSLSEKGSKVLWVYVPLLSKGRFDGFFFASFRTEGMFKTILNEEIVPGYGLEVFEGQTKIFSRDEDNKLNAQVWGQDISFPLDGITLRVRIWPTAKLLAEEQSSVPELLLVAGIAIAASLTFAVHQAQRARHRAKQVEQINRALHQEIRDRKTAEAALRQHLQMLDFANDSIIIRALNDKIIYWNQGAERRYGWTKEETLGKYIHTFLQTVFPQPLEEVLAFCKREGYWQGELIHTTQDAQQIIVASRWTLQRDENGEPSAILEINNDITEQKQAEAALRQSEERFRRCVENAPFPSIVHAEDGEVIAVNQAWTELSGYALEDIPTIADWTEKAYGERKTLVLPDIERLYNLDGRVEEGEYVITTANGSSRIWEFSSAPLGTLPDGRRLVMSMAVDVSDRKQTEEALRQSEAQIRQKASELEETLLELQRTQSQLIQSEKMSSLGQLVAGVAHEINNPVNFIYGNLTHAKDYVSDLLGLLQLYQETYSHPAPAIQAEIEAIELDFLMEDLPKLLSSMKVGAERIREIVLSLRTFSRLDESDMKEVDIHEGIESTLMILHNRTKSKPDRPAIQVIKDFGDLPLVECYPGQLNQVFMNILTNAIDALDDYNDHRSFQEIQAHPSTIAIRTYLGHGNGDSPFVFISIADNGPGMSEEVRKNLFNPFFTTKPIGKGTGLGLAISYDIVVEKHGGSLACISAPGKGAEFAIAIPLRQSSLLPSPTKVNIL